MRTDSAVRGLGALYRRRRRDGLEVIGIPCNQFRGQEPGTDQEIQGFCRTVYDITFPVFARAQVNGPDSIPLYQFLRSTAPGDFGPQYGDFYDAVSRIVPDARPGDVRWNFTKFLVDPQGAVVKRYEPPVVPAEIERDLEHYLTARGPGVEVVTADGAAMSGADTL